MQHLIRITVASMVLAGVAACTPPVGVRPTYGPTSPSLQSYATPIQHRVWVPNLDDFFDPQGLAVVSDRSPESILVSGFVRETYDRGDNKGQCRVFRVDPMTGHVQGRVDVETLPTCGHAGGIAYAGDGVLFIADSATLFRTTLETAFGTAPSFQKIPLADPLTGGNATFGLGALWLGTYKESGSGTLYRFDAETLAKHSDGTTLTAGEATRTIPLPSYTQGVAFHPDGRLWIARSDVMWGRLEQLDPETGAVIRGYDVPAGTEGIGFAKDARLWAVSEAGARRFFNILFVGPFLPFNPLIYAIDLTLLQR